MLQQLLGAFLLTILVFSELALTSHSPLPSNHSTMSKTVTSFTAQLVTFDTPLPVTDVIARLDVEINKQGSAEILQKLRTAATRAEIEEVVNTVTGANDFLCGTRRLHFVPHR